MKKGKRMTLKVAPSQQILENIKSYIEVEGLKRKRLAKRLDMSDSNFSEYLNGKRSTVTDFATKLAFVLGLEHTFFLNKDFKINTNNPFERTMEFSMGEDVSDQAKEGISQLLRLCDLVEIYNQGRN